MVTKYYYSTGRIHDMQIDLAELGSRSAATQLDYDQMYYALAQRHLFAEAKEWSIAHPSTDLGEVPSFRDESKGAVPTKVVLSRDAATLTRARVAMTSPAHLVVVSSPSCHFCQQAVRDLKGDGRLSALMKLHSTWLVPPDGASRLDDIRLWNEANPDETMALTYDVTEWPRFDDWGTPTFYFFRGSTLVSKLRGWPPTGGARRLRIALHEVGLL